MYELTIGTQITHSVR